jgi:hypothetical protein
MQAAFAGAESDPLFHNVSWSTAVVAIGQAMMHERAAMGWVFAGVGALFSGADGMGMIGSATGGGSLGAQGTGASVGGAYAAISTDFFHQDITQAQAGYLGKVSSGVLKPASSGHHETGVM